MPGLYLHIPFCLQKCHYCNFYSVVGSPATQQTFLSDLNWEIEFYSQESDWRALVFDTIYLGGGTPSMLGPSQVKELVTRVRQSFEIVANPEVTLEANPETITPGKLEGFLEAGINRLNLGVQSFHPDELNRLNRIHSARQARWCLITAKSAGFSNVGADLIFGIPGQTCAVWSENLLEMIDLAPEHISTYGLTLEPGTFLAQEIEAGRLAPVSEETEREMYLHTIDTLTAHGFEHYEISNFARPGLRSRHNQIYWRKEAYLGLGPSAHSFAPPLRWWNVADLDEYHARIARKERPIENSENLTREQQMLEMILLGLRRTEGIDLAGFHREFGEDFRVRFNKVLQKLDFSPDTSNPHDFFRLENDHLRLTRAGLLVYNEICTQFV